MCLFEDVSARDLRLRHVFALCMRVALLVSRRSKRMIAETTACCQNLAVTTLTHTHHNPEIHVAGRSGAAAGGCARDAAAG